MSKITENRNPCKHRMFARLVFFDCLCNNHQLPRHVIHAHAILSQPRNAIASSFYFLLRINRQATKASAQKIQRTQQHQNVQNCSANRKKADDFDQWEPKHIYEIVKSKTRKQRVHVLHEILSDLLLNIISYNTQVKPPLRETTDIPAADIQCSRLHP